MLKNINQIKYLPTLAFFLINIIIIANPLQAIAQRRLSVYKGDIPGKNPGCSIISMESLTNSELGKEFLNLTRGITPEQADAIITGNPSIPHWSVEGLADSQMQWSRSDGNRSVEILLRFKYRRLNEFYLIMRNGDAACAITVEK
ncbi:hypothetical protein IQ270_04370 [Microcoleus sp. LEGE 07076]|uniref:hypothetical protein n=1 Tax=Microcoleus sp. LEGE 07076 TaxID=915322 RepID=UPI001882F335|nr:hypothetical protein [Microcoleus sp. LEGE 07076]MBE9183977.1 hypothetical protein [Microcoleus sp. LEGE 07076]